MSATRHPVLTFNFVFILYLFGYNQINHPSTGNFQERWYFSKFMNIVISLHVLISNQNFFEYITYYFMSFTFLETKPFNVM